MVLDAEKLVNLCGLYPKTATSMKYRALDRRNYFMYHMQGQEREYGVDRDPKTGQKYTDNRVHTLDEEILFDEEIQDYTKVKLLCTETDATSSGNTREREVTKQAKKAQKQVVRMAQYLDSLQQDFDEGILKRVAPSRNPVERLEFNTEVLSYEDEDDAIYIGLENREEDSSGEDSEYYDLNGTINASRKASSVKSIN